MGFSQEVENIFDSVLQKMLVDAQFLFPFCSSVVLMQVWFCHLMSFDHSFGYHNWRIDILSSRETSEMLINLLYCQRQLHMVQKWDVVFSLVSKNPVLHFVLSRLHPWLLLPLLASHQCKLHYSSVVGSLLPPFDEWIEFPCQPWLL